MIVIYFVIFQFMEYKTLILEYRWHKNWYIGISNEHVLFWKHYDTHVDASYVREYQKDSYWLNYPVIPMVCYTKKEDDFYPMTLVVPVHGGLTYSSDINPESKEKDGLRWFGFDTMHSWDESNPETQSTWYMKRQEEKLLKRFKENEKVKYIDEVIINP